MTEEERLAKRREVSRRYAERHPDRVKASAAKHRGQNQERLRVEARERAARKRRELGMKERPQPMSPEDHAAYWREYQRQWAKRKRRSLGTPERATPTPKERAAKRVAAQHRRLVTMPPEWHAKRKEQMRQWWQSISPEKRREYWKRNYAKHGEAWRARGRLQSAQKVAALAFLRSVGVIRRGDGGGGRMDALYRAALAYVRQQGLMP